MIREPATISIHALLAESDGKNQISQNSEESFLSTLSLRRATRSHCSNDGSPIHFYPRSPCGERLRHCTTYLNCSRISIHALLAESDHPVTVFICVIKNFYPRSPCGERLAFRVFKSNCFSISIHALLAESDPKLLTVSILINAFLSTLSLRRATSWRKQSNRHKLFLSTLSLRRATLGARQQNYLRGNFYPRSPCGERLYRVGLGS